MMRYQFMDEVADSIEERPFSQGFYWFVFLLIVLFFIGFHSITVNSDYIPNQTLLIETEETNQAFNVVFSAQK